MKKTGLDFTAGFTIYASSGMIGRNQPDRMSTVQFYQAEAGSRLKLLDKNYCFTVASYRPGIDESYRNSYLYAPDQAWVTYKGDLGRDTYQQVEYVFSDKMYFRVCLKRVDGKDFTVEEQEQSATILCFYGELTNEPTAHVFTEENEDTIQKVRALEEPGDLLLAVLTDTHCTVNGTWQDTAVNLKMLSKKLNFAGIIHLGDLTDGMVPEMITTRSVKKIRHDLESFNVPVHIVLGNHDANYFAGNPYVLSLQEQRELYQPNNQQSGKPYYYCDYLQQNIRCVFLSAYDNNEQIRYGFDLPQINWLAELLANTPRNCKVLVFAHDAPLAELDYWSDEIRNGGRLVAVLEEQQKTNHNILAYIHGHTHADSIYRGCSFPIISIGCAKCEAMQEKKPTGSFTPERRLGEVTQELWDVVLVKPSCRKICMVRFGAGEDRIIQC